MSQPARLVGAVALVLGTAGGGGAQPAADTAPDLIRCWWRTSSGAVAIGETFAASLTCTVRADRSTDVMLDESRLSAAAIQLSPFEILDGSHPADLRTATHRFVQYHYTLRLISRDAIGRDVAFPDIQLSYRVRMSAAGEQVDGRDRTYVLPGQAIRVLSLVPVGTDDIRDSSGEDFAQVASLRFQARAFELTALALAALGLIVAAPAVVRLVRRSSPAADRSQGPPPRQVLAAASRCLDEVATAKSGGWSADLIARALVAGRLTAGMVLGNAISRQPQARGQSVPTERLLVRQGWLRPVGTTVASATTAADLDAAVAALPLTTPVSRRERLEDLHSALSTFTSALYHASVEPDSATLDAALVMLRRATTGARKTYRWPWPFDRSARRVAGSGA